MRLTVVAMGLLGALVVLGTGLHARAQDYGDLLKDAEKQLEEARKESRKARDAERKRRKKTGERGAWGVSADGALLAAGTPKGDIELWRPDETQPFRILKPGHGGIVDDIAITADELHAVADDGTLRIWNLEDGKLSEKLGKKDDENAYTSVSVSPDDRYVAMSETFGVGIWDDRTGDYLENTPLDPGIRRVTFLDDSRRYVLRNTQGVELHDVAAKPVRFDGEELPADPVWALHKKSIGGFGGRGKPVLGDALVTWAEVNEKRDVVVTLSMPGLLSRKKGWQLRGFDLHTGAKLWQVPVAGDDGRLLEARDADVAVLRDATELHFISLSNGKITRSFPIPKGRRVRVLAPDASAWFDADKKGNLIRVELIPKSGPDEKATPANPPGDGK